MSNEVNTGNEPLVSILEKQVIPWWERCGLDYFAATAPTLSAFKRQQVPQMMRTSVRKRIGGKTSSRGRRHFNNTNSFREIWSEDDQAIFNYPALVFILEGQADFHVADYIVHCPQSHFLLFSDNVPRPLGIRPHLDGKDGHCAVLWFFAPPGTNSVVVYACHSRGEEHWSEGYRIVHRLEVVNSFQLFIREVQERAVGYQRVASTCFQTFLHLFWRELEEGRFFCEGDKAWSVAVHLRDSSPIQSAQQYVKTHLSQPLTASRVAREVFMSRNRFMQCFAEQTGQTFHQFVTQTRMEEARRLLSEGHWSIVYICRFIGLKPTQFRAQFRSYFGLTPSELRKQLQIKVQNR